VQNLRAIIKSAVPETTELVKNKNITYKLNNKDFVWIRHFQNHVDLDFSMGASLDSDLLKSRGKKKPEIVRLLKAAAINWI
jgi:hypothetical protein